MTPLTLLLVAFLPSLLLIGYIFYKDSVKHEPVRLLVKGFIYGILSIIPAIVLELIFEDFFSGSYGMKALSPALIEEGSKALMLWLLLRNNKHFDEYFDGIVYAVTVGVGFEFTENIFYFVEDPSCIGARLLLPGHFAYAIIMGYYVGLAHFSKGFKRKWNIAMALAMPIASHWLWDFCCFAAEESPMLVLIFLCLLIALIIFIRRAIRAQQRRDAELQAQQEAQAYAQQWFDNYTNQAEQETSYETKNEGMNDAFENLKFM